MNRKRTEPSAPFECGTWATCQVTPPLPVETTLTSAPGISSAIQAESDPNAPNPLASVGELGLIPTSDRRAALAKGDFTGSHDAPPSDVRTSTAASRMVAVAHPTLEVDIVNREVDSRIGDPSAAYVRVPTMRIPAPTPLAQNFKAPTPPDDVDDAHGADDVLGAVKMKGPGLTMLV